MNFLNIYYPIKVLAVISFVAISTKYWFPAEIFFYLLVSPYAVLYFLSNKNNYRNTKLTVIRAIPAVITFLLVPILLFGIEPDAQAGIALMLGLITQLASISAAEFIILFFINDESANIVGNQQR